jgi:hypothetical protein
MVSKVEELYEKAMQLGEDEREVLLLLLTNAAQCDDENNGWASAEIEQAWMEEIERREQLAAEGKMEWLPAEEVFRCLREQLRK